MWLFFFGQSQMTDWSVKTYDHNESGIKIIPKNPKKRVSKMETQFVSINFISYNTVLIEIHQVFSNWTLKKKEQKRARAIFRDFYKRKKILQITFFHEKNAYFTKNKNMPQ